jgi:molybdopterin converting factor small subunit
MVRSITMRIHVKALRPFKEALGAGDLELERPEGETVEGLIHHLVEEHPAFGPLALDGEGGIDVTLNIMVSGLPTGEHDLARPLRDGDEVMLFMPLAGG